jgi:cell division control protein 7
MSGRRAQGGKSSSPVKAPRSAAKKRKTELQAAYDREDEDVVGVEADHVGRESAYGSARPSGSSRAFQNRKYIGLAGQGSSALTDFHDVGGGGGATDDGAGPADEGGSAGRTSRGSRSTGTSRKRSPQDDGPETLEEAERLQMDELNQITEIREAYDVLEVIGSGTFSTVFKARLNRTAQQEHRKKKGKVGEGKVHYRALKRIVFGCAPRRIEREIECLKRLDGKHHVVAITSVLRERDCVVLVLKHFEHEPFQDYKDELSIQEIGNYMRALMDALAHVHGHGIIHRDVKPTNFLYHRGHKNFLLVDFGLAQKVGKGGDDGAVQLPKKYDTSYKTSRPRSTLRTAGVFGNGEDKRREQSAARAGTRGFRAPEVLFKCWDQSPAIDVWSAGVILLTFLSGRSPFFLSNTDTDSIVELAETFGVKELSYVASNVFGKELLIGAGQRAKTPYVAKKSDDLRTICETLRPNGPEADELAYEFLRHCLMLDPLKRITAEKALSHPFLNT